MKYLSYIFIVLFIPCAAYSMDMPELDDDGRLWDIFDDPNIEQDLFIDGFLDTVSLNALPSRKITPELVVTQLADKGLIPVLAEDFYLHTNPLVKRSLLDLPIFEIHLCSPSNEWIVGGHLFWNHTNRSVFACDSTNINSYINFNQETLFGKIEELANDPTIGGSAEGFADLIDNTDFEEILDLFADFTVQQRRTGVMFHASKKWDRTEARFLMPLFYQERNIFTEPARQALIESRFGVQDNTSQEQFQQNHAVSDRVGLGDLRFEFDYAGYKTETTEIRFGVMGTLPTNVTIATGMQGTTFDKNLAQPTLDLNALLDLVCLDSNGQPFITNPQEANDILIGDICRNQTGFLIGILDRLDALLLDTPTGNYRHLGLGFLFRARTLLSTFLDEFSWAERISFNNRMSLEFFTPDTYTRFFAKRTPLSEIEARDYQSDNEAVQEANLNFIGQTLVNKFYPLALQASIQPRFIFRFTNRWCYSGDVWDVNFGSDFWLQPEEKIGKIKCISQKTLDCLDVCNAHAPFAYQLKYYGGLGAKVVRPESTWLFSINAEGTTWSKGIGKDWTVSLNIESNF